MPQLDKAPGVAFFDFDGTISTRDTLPVFLRFACGTMRYTAALLHNAPLLLGYLLGCVEGGRAKERLLGSLLAGRERGELLATGEAFCASVLPAILRPQAIERIRVHQRLGHRVVVITASLEEWLAPWCRTLGIEIQGTRLAYDNGKATGRFATPNCRGQEKLRRASECLGTGERPRIYAYGDSRGDKNLLAWADQSWYRPFRGNRQAFLLENNTLHP